MSGSDSENDVVMVSYNWGCDVSTDGGATWRLLSPYTVFPNTLAGGFCCDQVVLYVPRSDIFCWFLQYGADAAGQGAFRIAVATSDSVLNDPTAWTYWDFVAGDFGWPTADMDYPDMSYSDRYLYVSTDVMGSGRVTMRIQLEELRNGGTINFEYTDPEDGKNVWGAHLVQQTTDMGLWAGHQDNSHLVFFTLARRLGHLLLEHRRRRRVAERHHVVCRPGRHRLADQAAGLPRQRGHGRRPDSRTVTSRWRGPRATARPTARARTSSRATCRYVEIEPGFQLGRARDPGLERRLRLRLPSLARAGDYIGIALGWGGAVRPLQLRDGDHGRLRGLVHRRLDADHAPASATT